MSRRGYLFSFTFLPACLPSTHLLPPFLCQVCIKEHRVRKILGRSPAVLRMRPQVRSDGRIPSALSVPQKRHLARRHD